MKNIRKKILWLVALMLILTTESCVRYSYGHTAFRNTLTLQASVIQRNATSKHGNCFVMVDSPEKIYVWRYETDKHNKTRLHITTLCKGHAPVNVLIDYPAGERWYITPSVSSEEVFSMMRLDESTFEYHGWCGKLYLSEYACLHNNTPDSMPDFYKHVYADVRKYVVNPNINPAASVRQ